MKIYDLSMCPNFRLCGQIPAFTLHTLQRFFGISLYIDKKTLRTLAVSECFNNILYVGYSAGCNTISAHFIPSTAADIIPPA